MQIGLVGSGNMARALAVGWGEPLLCTDKIPDRAEALAREVGGEALASNASLAERADVVVLCHKPAQLEEVAAEIAGKARAVVSILASTPHEQVQAAYPGTPVIRVMPNVAVEVRRGVVCHAAGHPVDPALEREVLERFARVGTVVTLDESLLDAAMGLMSCSPAYVALVAEAQIDAGIRRGIPAPEATKLVVEAMAGSAELLAARGGDTLSLRRSVTSPGGTTARGLRALEDAGVRAAFHDALDAAIGT